MYGWNWSAYKVPECAATIVTGYRSFPAGLYLSQQQMDDLNNARNTEKIRNLLIDWTLENRKEKEK